MPLISDSEPIYIQVKRSWRERLRLFPFNLFPSHRRVRDFDAEEQRERDRAADVLQVHQLREQRFMKSAEGPASEPWRKTSDTLEEIAEAQRKRQQREQDERDAYINHLNEQRAYASLAEAGFAYSDFDKSNEYKDNKVINSGRGGDFGGAGADGSWDEKPGPSHHDLYEQRLMQHGALAGSTPSHNLCGNASGLTGIVGLSNGNASASFTPTQQDMFSPPADADTDSNDTQPVLHLIQPEIGNAVGSEPLSGFFQTTESTPSPAASETTGSGCADSSGSTPSDDRTDWSAA